MANRQPRDLFTVGHKRKFLVIVDESPEGETALYYAARRVHRTGGSLSLLFVIEPIEMTHWLGVDETFREEQYHKARAVFRLRARKLKTWGFEEIVPEEIIREGPLAEEIVKLIEEDREFGILVLGASTDPKGPGPLVSSLAGAKAGTFPIPIAIVPGNLTLEEVNGLA
ncbi:universal stress protein [Rhodomicrobium sp. Az07]|uniref:universal stress protein n=1 Tax=Rhodomicrobium sp. Az07 TaxID=2839034 RepID=UPI001BEC976F|nr:universal stress protein [Rhodomicrobium sp. Az07]MBT3071695.1 universal stress protein [Rhodomicrobium sp. Az07]